MRLRDTLALHKQLVHRLAELEREIEGRDTSIRTIFGAIRELAAPPAAKAPAQRGRSVGTGLWTLGR